MVPAHPALKQCLYYPKDMISHSIEQRPGNLSPARLKGELGLPEREEVSAKNGSTPPCSFYPVMRSEIPQVSLHRDFSQGRPCHSETW